MPKNEVGEVKCINEGVSINGSSTTHEILTIPESGVILKEGRDAMGGRTIEKQGMPIILHRCKTCHYVEFYFNTPN